MTMEEIQSPIEIFQDNTSCMKISVSGSRTNKHIRRRFHYIEEQIENGNIKLTHLSTNEMTADIMTKPVQGSQFVKFRNQIMNCEDGKEVQETNNKSNDSQRTYDKRLEGVL